MRKLNLREAEAKQLAELEKLGLHRLITHTRYNEPTDVDNYKKIIAVTRVELVDAKQWKEKAGDEAVTNIGNGWSYCSHRDQFSKRRGRVIATARAIKNHSR